MMSRRLPPTAVPVDLTEIAQLLRTAADQIRRDALARYELEMERAAVLDAAAGQAERAPAAPSVAPAAKAASPRARAAKAVARPKAAAAPAEKAPAKKAPAEKAPAKKARAKQAPAKQAPAKKAPAKKAPVAAAPGEATLMDRVVAVVRDTPSRTWTAAQVAEAVGGRPGTVSTFLARAATRGLIARAERGAYRAA